MIVNRAFHMGFVLAVTAHMLFGCWLHHAHAYGLRDTTIPGVDAPLACPHRPTGPNHTCSTPSERRKCDGAKCVFTRPEPDDTPDLSLGHSGLTLVCVSPSIPASEDLARCDSQRGEPGLVIPLHLLNQVLLI